MNDRLEELRQKYPGKYLQLAPKAPNDRRNTSDGLIWWADRDIKLSQRAGTFCFRVVGKASYGISPRDAYHEWWHAWRLSKYNAADLLKERGQLVNRVKALQEMYQRSLGNYVDMWNNWGNAVNQAAKFRRENDELKARIAELEAANS